MIIYPIPFDFRFVIDNSTLTVVVWFWLCDKFNSHVFLPLPWPKFRLHMHETAINSMIIYPIPLDFRFVIDNSTLTVVVWFWLCDKFNSHVFLPLPWPKFRLHMHETAINSMIIYPIPLDFRFVIDNSTLTVVVWFTIQWFTIHMDTSVGPGVEHVGWLITLHSNITWLTLTHSLRWLWWKNQNPNTLLWP